MKRGCPDPAGGGRLHRGDGQKKEGSRWPPSPMASSIVRPDPLRARGSSGLAADGRQLAALQLVLGGGVELELLLVVLALDLDHDRVLAREGAPEDLLAERVLDHVLDGATERPGAVIGVVALDDQVIL